MTFEMLRSPVMFLHLAPTADPHALEEIASRVEAHLALPVKEKEADAEAVFRDLAVFTAETLVRRLTGKRAGSL